MGSVEPGRGFEYGSSVLSWNKGPGVRVVASTLRMEGEPCSVKHLLTMHLPLSLAFLESPSVLLLAAGSELWLLLNGSHPVCPGYCRGGGRELSGIKWLDAQPFFTSAQFLNLVTANICRVLAVRPYGS